MHEQDEALRIAVMPVGAIAYYSYQVRLICLVQKVKDSKRLVTP
jgi:hypothetical protein